MSRYSPVRRLLVPLVALAFLLLGPVPAGITGSSQVSYAAITGVLHLSRTQAAAGDAVTVFGAGFTPSSIVTVNVTFRATNGLQRESVPANVGSNGTFSATIRVPGTVYRGQYTVTASDGRGHFGSTGLTILPLLTLSVGGTATTRSVTAGHAFYVSGSGFAANESVVVAVQFPHYVGGLYRGNTVLVSKTVQADASGHFYEALIQTPRGTRAGTYTVTARGATSTRSATGSIAVVYVPFVTATPSTAAPGQTLSVRGGGFVPGSLVKVTGTFPLYNGNSAVVSRTVRAGAQGHIFTGLPVPYDAQATSVPLTAIGQLSGKSATIRVAVTYHPTVTVGTGTIRPGGTLAVSGHGFVPNSRVQLTVSPHAGSQLSAIAIVDASGTFNATIAVPAGTAVGAFTLTAVDSTGGFQATAHANIAVHAAITAQPAAAHPGQTVVITGSGYSAGVTVQVTATVPLVGGAPRVLSTAVKTGANGAFSVNLPIPRRAAAGNIVVTAQGPHTSARAALRIQRLGTAVALSPASAIPGSSITVTGSGYLANDRIDIAVTFRLTNGTSKVVTATATTGAHGHFTAFVRVPRNAAGGAYTVTARSEASGRAPTARLVVSTLAASVVVLPTTAVPGTRVTVRGFGFAAGETVTLSLHGQTVGTVTTGATGTFSTSITIPAASASGTDTLIAQGSRSGRASINLTINRQVATRFYVSSIYTGPGYHEYITMLNSTPIRARVTITYMRTNGATTSKTIEVNGQTRATEDVNADIGPRVSAAAIVTSDVGIAVERAVYHGTDAAAVPGTRRLSTVWYFANGNTGKHYREYIAVQNPNPTPVQLAVHFLPTHHAAFTVYRNMPATSRTTFKVSSFVKKDAVGVSITASGPVVANRTIFNKAGITSKDGARAPRHHWYFATGPGNASAHYWIAAINPTPRWTYMTLRTYGVGGGNTGSVTHWLRPYARVGYLINKIAHRTDVAVVVNGSRGIVAEQTTYLGSNHNDSTDTFGAVSPAKSWMFAAVNTVTSAGDSDYLSLFNPALVQIPVAVNFYTTAGKVVTRTYTIAPFAHIRINVGRVVPNAQAGVVAASNYPFVALNRGFLTGGAGSFTTGGVR